MNQNPQSPGDYASIDAAILAALVGTPLVLSEIYAAVRPTIEATGLANPDRVVDRRLIELARTGHIVQIPGGWQLNPDAPVTVANPDPTETVESELTAAGDNGLNPPSDEPTVEKTDDADAAVQQDTTTETSQDQADASGDSKQEA